MGIQAPVAKMTPQTNLLGIFFCNPKRFDFVYFLNVSKYDNKPCLYTIKIDKGKFKFNSLIYKTKDFRYGRQLGMGLVELIERDK